MSKTVILRLGKVDIGKLGGKKVNIVYVTSAASPFLFGARSQPNELLTATTAVSTAHKFYVQSRCNV